MRPWLWRRLHAAPGRAQGAPTDGLCYFAPDARRRVVFVSVLGVAAALLEEIVATTQRRLGGGAELVYISDQPDFLPFRRRKAMFEYIPSILDQQRLAPEKPWPLFLEERFALIQAKWRPELIVSYGDDFKAFAERARQAAPPALQPSGGTPERNVS